MQRIQNKKTHILVVQDSKKWWITVLQLYTVRILVFNYMRYEKFCFLVEWGWGMKSFMLQQILAECNSAVYDRFEITVKNDCASIFLNNTEMPIHSTASGSSWALSIMLWIVQCHAIMKIKSIYLELSCINYNCRPFAHSTSDNIKYILNLSGL